MSKRRHLPAELLLWLVISSCLDKQPQHEIAVQS